MTVLSWSKGQFPPWFTHVAAVVGIAGAVLLILAYFAMNVMQDRAYRKLHEEEHECSRDPEASPDGTPPPDRQTP